MLLLKDNKFYFLLYLFLTGIGDGLFFLGVGKLLSTRMEFLLGASLMFIINELAKLSFQFLASTFETELSMKNSIAFSELFQSCFLISVVIFSFNIFSANIIILSLVILNFFDGLSKVAEFHLTMEIFSPEERKKFNSYITSINQTSKIFGFILGGCIIAADKYELLFILNAVSFILSGSSALQIHLKDKKIKVQSSWRELFNQENYHILVYTFIIASNTVVLSSNAILGFNLSLVNVKQTIAYQVANALGSTISILFIRYSMKWNRNENMLVVAGIFFQGILFLSFNFLEGYSKAFAFIVISIISFFNLSLYITKLQNYAEKKFGGKIYSVRQLNRAIFNLFGISALTALSLQLKVDYQNIVAIFCFFICGLNMFLIKNRIITYIPSS